MTLRADHLTLRYDDRVVVELLCPRRDRVGDADAAEGELDDRPVRGPGARRV